MRPKWHHWKKLGEVIAAIVAGTDAAKSELHRCNIILERSGLDHDVTPYVASHFACMSYLTGGFVDFANYNSSMIRQSDIGHQDTEPLDKFRDPQHSSVELGLRGTVGESGLLLVAEPPNC
jgi:hypothetical protein